MRSRRPGNFYDYVPPGTPPAPELCDILAKNSHVRIERIVSNGQTSDWYDQEESEFVLLLAGIAQLEFADGTVEFMDAGSTRIIRPHEKHRVKYTSNYPPALWLCVFY